MLPVFDKYLESLKTLVEIDQKYVDFAENQSIDKLLPHIFKEGELRIAEYLKAGQAYEIQDVFDKHFSDYKIDVEKWVGHKLTDTEMKNPNKIGKLLNRKKQELIKAGDTVEAGKIDKLLKIPDLKKQFNNKSSVVLIYSRAPIDVLRMSDHPNTSSCHAQGGQFFQCAIADSGVAGIIFAITKEDYEANVDNLQDNELFHDSDRGVNGILPLGRLRLRVVYNDATKDYKRAEIQIAVPSSKFYGSRNRVVSNDMVTQAAQYFKRAQQKIVDNLPDNISLVMGGGTYEDPGDGVTSNFKRVFGKDVTIRTYRKDEENVEGEFDMDENDNEAMYLEQFRDEVDEALESKVDGLVVSRDGGDITFDLKLPIPQNYHTEAIAKIGSKVSNSISVGEFDRYGDVTFSLGIDIYDYFEYWGQGDVQTDVEQIKIDVERTISQEILRKIFGAWVDIFDDDHADGSEEYALFQHAVYQWAEENKFVKNSVGEVSEDVIYAYSEYGYAEWTGNHNIAIDSYFGKKYVNNPTPNDANENVKVPDAVVKYMAIGTEEDIKKKIREFERRIEPNFEKLLERAYNKSYSKEEQNKLEKEQHIDILGMLRENFYVVTKAKRWDNRMSTNYRVEPSTIYTDWTLEITISQLEVILNESTPDIITLGYHLISTDEHEDILEDFEDEFDEIIQKSLLETYRNDDPNQLKFKFMKDNVNNVNLFDFLIESRYAKWYDADGQPWDHKTLPLKYFMQSISGDVKTNDGRTFRLPVVPDEGILQQSILKDIGPTLFHNYLTDVQRHQVNQNYMKRYGITYEQEFPPD
jgi:hypothetical protein